MPRLVLIGLTVVSVGLAIAFFPRLYFRPQDDILSGAKREKALVVYSTLHDDLALGELLAGFRRKYPYILLQNTDGDAAPTFRRFTEEVRAGKPSADFLWGPAMDLQEKLINDGYAQAYESPQISFLPSWAHWKDLGYGVTLEPIVFVYNSRFLSPREMPKTHNGLRDLLRKNPERFRRRVALYNPQRSEVGMLLSSQDIRVTRDTWDLFETLGAIDAAGYDTSGNMLNHIVSGDQWIGYDAIASYAVEMRKKHPELVVVYPADYVLVMSRVAFIAASARHPNAARLFLDYLLSGEAQTILKRHGMGSVRADVGVPAEQSRLESVRTQAIRIGPGLLADLDSAVRAQFLRRWSQIFDRGAKGSGDFRLRTHSPLQLGVGSETGQLP